MFKKTMEFDDLDGNPTKQTFYFNYTKLEIAKMLEFDQLEQKMADLTETAEEKGMTDPENTRQAYEIFEELIAGAYGVKSEDQMEFMKSPEITERWKHHVAFPELIFEMLGDTSLAADFVEKCLPPRLVASAKAELSGGKVQDEKSIADLVEEANRRQEDPKTRIEPNDTSLLEKTDEAVTTELLTDGKTDAEILEMKPQTMTADQLQRAFALKTKRD